MSLYRHHAMILTSGEDPPIKLSALRSIAINELELPVSEIVQAPRNAYYSFAVLPDGSSETFDFSDQMDDARAKLARLAMQERIQYIEVYFGGDYGLAAIAQHSGMDVETKCARCGRQAYLGAKTVDKLCTRCHYREARR